MTGTIQAAFDTSQHGDTVMVQPGHYHGHFQVPAHDILLASRYLFDPDTSFIVNTILDGDLTGTVLTVPEGDHWFRLNGMTVTGGLFRLNPDASWIGGGIWVQQEASLDVRNAVFTGNDGLVSGNWGSAIFGGFIVPGGEHFVGEVVLENIQITNNGHTGISHQPPMSEAIALDAHGPVHASRIFCNGAGLDDAALYVRSEDSLVVRDLRITGYRSEIGHSNYTLCSLTGETVVDISDVRIWDNQTRGGTYLNAWGPDFLRLRNVEVFDNTDSLSCPGEESCHPFTFVDISADSCAADSIRFHGNVRAERSLFQLWTSQGGNVKNLNIVNNWIGTADRYSDIWQGFAYMFNIELEHAQIADNTMELPPRPTIGGYAGPGMIMCENMWDETGPDSLIWMDVVFRNNQVIEHTLPEHKRAGMIGRALRMSSLFYGHMIFQDCAWIGNHTNLIAPEADNWLNWRNVGSTVEIRGIYPSQSDLVMENCLFQDNDDGGLWASEFGQGRISNCRFIDNDRFALKFWSNSDVSDITVENIFISGTNAQMAFLPYSQYQGVMEIASDSRATLSNITVTNCSVPYICWLGDVGGHVPAYVANSVFSGLDYDEFVSTGEPGQNTSPGDFHYCLADQALPGSDNVIDDPRFNAHLGPPFLATDSPCIDTGDPDPTCNDAEDPANPGFPLWPALGILRNDMGFTGGPHAVAMDTSDVSVPDWQPSTKPKDFTLGAPWPNPFNPVIHLPCTLARPMPVKLTVHNLLGQQVAVLHEGFLPAGTFRYQWNAAGQASGLYFITLQVDLDRTETRAVALLR